MSILFIKIDQIVGLDSSQSIVLTDRSFADLGIQFSFAVPSGSIGFEAEPSSFVEGGVKLEKKGNRTLAHIFGIIKIKIYEMQEMQINNRTPIFINGLTVKNRLDLVRVVPLEGQQKIKNSGEDFPVAIVELGRKKTALATYP